MGRNRYQRPGRSYICPTGPATYAPQVPTSSSQQSPSIRQHSAVGVWLRSAAGVRLSSAAGVRASALSRRNSPAGSSRPRRTDQPGRDQVYPERVRATTTAPDEDAAIPPPQRPPQLAADEWLHPLAFLPPGALLLVPSGWVPWASSLGTPHLPRRSVFAAPSPSLGVALGSRRLDGGASSCAGLLLGGGLACPVGDATDLPEFRTCQRNNPKFKFKPRLSGSSRRLWHRGRFRPNRHHAASGTHFFICARLAPLHRSGAA